MLRQGIAHCRRVKFLTQNRIFHTFLKLEFSMYDNGEYSRLLYTRLSLDNNYQYLDSNYAVEPDPGAVATRLISTLQSREENPGTLENLEGEVLNTFKEWATSVQLRVGYLMHLNKNINSRQYLDGIIEQMGSGDLNNLESHELVALLLLIYFRKDLTVDDISQYLDLDELQIVFALKIQRGQLKPEEICAGCLGLKKIKDLRLKNDVLRHVLYDLLNTKNLDSKFKDFYFMTIISTLTKGNQVYHDTPVSIEKAFLSFLEYSEDVSVMTAIKMMTYGINNGLENQELTDKVCNRVISSIDQLNCKDMLGLTYFFSKSNYYNLKLLLLLKGEISRLFDTATSIEEIVDVLNSLSHLAINDVYRMEVITPFIQAINDIKLNEVKHSNLSTMGKEMIKNIAEKHPHKDALLGDLSSIDQNIKLSSSLVRIPAFLTFNLRLDQVELDLELNMDLAASILSLFHKKIPLQIQTPQMSSDKLENRSKLLVNCYRGAVKILGSPRFVGVGRILPHFHDPDIIFGNIGGTPVSIPEYLTDLSILRPKRAPAGDWNVLVIANRKNLNSENKLIGTEEVKVRQLEFLGFTPIVVPYSKLLNPLSAEKSILSFLRKDDITLPNVDEGWTERNKKF